MSSMKLAYADPPYLGCAHLYAEKEEVDHRKLLERLKEYDGWALSCSSPSLRILLPMCPVDIRIGAFVKPFASFKPGVNPAYAWEPVLFRPARNKHGREIETVRDWVASNIMLQKGLVGAKPTTFCFWLFRILGAEPDDDFDDLFPGTGIVSKCWRGWQETQHNQMHFGE